MSQGICFCYDFTHDSDQRNDDDHDCKTKDRDNDFGLHRILQALIDSDATPEAIRVAAISAVKSTQAQLEQNHEQDQKEARERAKTKRQLKTLAKIWEVQVHKTIRNLQVKLIKLKQLMD